MEDEETRANHFLPCFPDLAPLNLASTIFLELAALGPRSLRSTLSRDPRVQHRQLGSFHCFSDKTNADAHGHAGSCPRSRTLTSQQGIQLSTRRTPGTSVRHPRHTPTPIITDCSLIVDTHSVMPAQQSRAAQLIPSSQKVRAPNPPLPTCTNTTSLVHIHPLFACSNARVGITAKAD